jgi:IS1 family transposase
VGLLAALAQAGVSKALNTAFVARHNGTDRTRTARKVRKRSCCSKNWAVDEAGTYGTLSSANCC